MISNFYKIRLEELAGVINYGRFPLSTLVKQAKKFNDFNEFSTFYVVQIYHGYYWHLTHNPDFKISDTTGPRDMSSLSTGEVSENGALMMTSDLDYWNNYYNYKDTGGLTDKKAVTRPYAALIDASDVDPKYLRQVGRGFGNEVYLAPENAKNVKVLGTYSLKYAKSLDRKFHDLIPQSKEALFKLYTFAHSNK